MVRSSILRFSELEAEEKLGTTIRVRGEVTQAGRTMAMIRGTIKSLDGKTTYCTCEHHKVSVPTQPEHLKHKVPWDDLWEAEKPML